MNSVALWEKPYWRVSKSARYGVHALPKKDAGATAASPAGEDVRAARPHSRPFASIRGEKSPALAGSAVNDGWVMEPTHVGCYVVYGERTR